MQLIEADAIWICAKDDQPEDAVKQHPDTSRRRFLKMSSTLGLTAALRSGAIGESFSDLKSRSTQKESAMNQTGADNAAIRPFHVNVPEADLADLRRRINATRWPEREL